MGLYFLFCLLWIISFCSYNVVCATSLTSTEEKDERIVGGSSAGVIPSVASVRSAIPQGNFHLCGGFIINKHWVGTVAQCLALQTINNTVVAVGTSTIAGGVIYELRQIELHQNYNDLTLMNDIALLRTERQILFSTAVASMPLATNNFAIATGTSVTIYGWGRTSAGGNLNASLRRGAFNVLSHLDCSTRFPFVARRFITDRHICTQTNTRATCPGDAGGPIVFNNTVVGIVSWVEPCVSGQTNVNIRVSFYANWILGFTRADD